MISTPAAWNASWIVPDGADAGREQPLLDDVANRVSDPHAIETISTCCTRTAARRLLRQAATRRRSQRVVSAILGTDWLETPLRVDVVG